MLVRDTNLHELTLYESLNPLDVDPIAVTPSYPIISHRNQQDALHRQITVSGTGAAGSGGDGSAGAPEPRGATNNDMV